MSILVFGIVVLILAVLNIVAWDPETFGGSAICLLVTSVVAVYCIFFAVVGTKSYSDNTLTEYDFSTMTTEYRLKDDAGIYYFDSEKGAWPIQFDFLQLPFGSFEEGEEVYVLSLISSNGCIEVSNGEKCGYVKEEDLEALHTYTYYHQAIEDNTPIYSVLTGEQTYYDSGDPYTVTIYYKGDEIIGYLSAGEEVEVREGVVADRITLIETSDGVYGAVDKGHDRER